MRRYINTPTKLLHLTIWLIDRMARVDADEEEVEGDGEGDKEDEEDGQPNEYESDAKRQSRTYTPARRPYHRASDTAPC